MSREIHPRVFIVQAAELELSEAVNGIIEKHALTYAELWHIFNQVEASWIKWAIRDERHPNEPDKPGGLA